MQFAKRQWNARWSRHAAAALALALLFGFLGPFGTQASFDRPTRYAFWLGLTLFGYLCTLAAFVLVDAAPGPARRNVPARLLLAALVSSVPQTLAVAWTLALLQPGRRFAPTNLLELFATVLMVQLVMAIVVFVLDRRTSAPAAATTSRASPKFLDKVPPHLSGDLIALEAQDHYLKVHTDRGAHMLLMRLSDAAAELSSHDGLQVHRGWWVASDAVDRIETRSGRTVLYLSNGLAVPVSRTYLRAVRGNGWGAGG